MWVGSPTNNGNVIKNKVLFNLLVHLINTIYNLEHPLDLKKCLRSFQENILLLGVRSKLSHGPRSRFRREVQQGNSEIPKNRKETKVHYVFGMYLTCQYHYNHQT